ncbi:MAG TPA: alpha/beta hydrolase [Solimonas sp.]|nr:alpha/beta hydrolase [Solimonas sp.]
MRKLISLAAAVLMAAGCSGQQVLNTFTPGSGYDLATNLPFDDKTTLKLDIYTPEDAANAPVVVFFFGGRWSDGDKEQYKFVGQALASRGFVAVLPNYRLYPQVRFPEFMGDAARAVRWVHSHIADYGGSADRLFVMGHSSGAHIAAMLALNEQYLKDVGGSRTWLKGMIGLAGPYDFLPITAPDLRDLFSPPEKFVLSQPIYYVDGLNPPMLLVHGENDDVVFVKNTRNLAKAVAGAGGQVETLIYPDMSHSWIVGSFATLLRRGTDVLENVASFIRRQADAPPVTRTLDIQATPLPPEDIQTTPLVEP